MPKHFPTKKIVAGIDEAGRGCLAGPVVSAAVILPKNFNNPILNDSKTLSESKRKFLAKIIKKEAIFWSIGISNVKEIDDINILNASFLSMHRAINKLTKKPDILLIDGNRFKKYPKIDHLCIIKGDAKFMSIAAASIIAKTSRDKIMKELDAKHPNYHWKKNKGYPTKKHRSSILEYGINQHHRKSFKLLPNQLTLSL